MSFRIIPVGGRMCSLRRGLMLWLLPLFLMAIVFATGCAYWGYSRMVGTFMDHQMVVLAESIAAGNAPLAMQPQTKESVDEWGIYAVQLWGADASRPTSASFDGSGVQRQAQPGFDDVQTPAGRWRVYTAVAERVEPRADQPVRQVQVMQNLDFRRGVVFSRAGESVLPILLLLPLTAFVLWRVIAAVSQQLGEVAREAAEQDIHTATAVALDRVPLEIQPLVAGFNRLMDRGREAYLQQRRFVQDAAHELRTPIAAIGLQLECMRNDAPCAESAARFTQLEAGVQRAGRLVDQLMKLSRQESAAARDATSTVDVHAMVRDSVGALIALADQKRIDLGLAGDAPTAPVALDCPAGELRSVVDNLVENALRYTPEGGTVDVRVTPASHPGGLAIEVIDTGPGIPEDMLPRVFDRFFRVPGTDVRGSGLGLAIAQAAAGRCGLEITLANRSDRSGLVARVSVPQAAGRSVRDSDGHANAAAYTASGPLLGLRPAT